MLCAGERREIRTDNGKRERPQKKPTKGAEDYIDTEWKNSWETDDEEMI